MPPRGFRKPEHEKWLTKYQVNNLLWGARKVSDRHPRAFDLIALMYVLGLRVGEAILLRYEHVGLTDTGNPPAIREVRVPTLKKRRRFNADGSPRQQKAPPLIGVPVLAHFDWIRDAFDERRRKGRAALSVFLFPSPQSRERPMTTRHATRIFRDAAIAGGVPRWATTHALRHSASAAMVQNYFKPRGWSREETLEVLCRFLRQSPGGPAGHYGKYAATATYFHDGDRKHRADQFVRVQDWRPLIDARAIDLPLPLVPGALAIDPLPTR